MEGEEDELTLSVTKVEDRKPWEDIVVLNIGGECCSTLRKTLADSNKFFPHSLLARIFSERMREMVLEDEEGRVFIDKDMKNFLPVLNVLRLPELISDIPSHMSGASWKAELEYWGLVERVEMDNEANLIKPLGEMTMREVSEKLRKDIARNEESVIKHVFESTGYYDRAEKSRTATLHIPVGHYELPWGSDLGEILKANSLHYTDLFHSLLGVSDISIKQDSHKKITYEFQGKSYTTQDTKTMTITFTMPFVSSNKK